MTRRRLVQIVALAGLYLLVARLGLAMDAVSGFATLVWPPTGLSLAALVLLGPGVWPGVALGALAANLWTGAPLAVAAGIALGNTAEALLGAWALRAFGFRPTLDRLRDALALVLCASLGSSAVSASVGVASLWLGHLAAPGRILETWRAWWIGDAIGDMIVAPVLLTIFASRTDRTPVRRARVAEGAAVAVCLVAACLFVFAGPSGGAAAPFRSPNTILPLIIWAALRFGPRGATTAMFVVAAAAIAGTALGGGPFVRGRLSESLVFLQVFMGIVASTMLILGAVSDERRHALALRDSLISIASHELKTPLTSLTLAVQLLARAVRRDPLPVDRIAEDADAAERHVKRLGRLVDDLLDVSRIFADRIRLDLEDVDLAVVMREVVARDPDSARLASIVTEGDAPVIGRWDRMRVEQIASNLVSNAVKYGAGRPVEIAVERRGERARLSVRDHGVGIRAEDRARIFERFERAVGPADPATSASSSGGAPRPTPISGFGLGLWIVRHVVKALGGTIEVESEVGVGSTFTVELPIAGQPAGRLLG